MSARLVSDTGLGGRLRLLMLDSDAVGSVAVRVLLPARFSAEPDRRWPVLFLLHGMWEDGSCWTRETDIDELTADLDLLVVMPDADRFGYYVDWWNHGQGGRPMWEAFHTVELPDLLDRHLRASGRRVVAGLSMGGYGAMHYATRRPDLFLGAASFSGTVDVIGAPYIPAPLDPQAFGDRERDAGRVAEHDPVTQAERLRGLSLYLSWGDGTPGPLDEPGQEFDEDEAWISRSNERLAARLHELGIPVTTSSGPGTHAWPYWQRALREALPMLIEALERE